MDGRREIATSVAVTMTGLVAALVIGLAVAVFVAGGATPQTLRMHLALRNRSVRPSIGTPTARGRGMASGHAAEGTPPRLVPTAPATTPITVTVLVASVVGAGVAGVAIGPAGVVAVIVAVPSAWWLRRRRSADIARRRRSTAVADACLIIGSELTAGASPHRALESAAHEWPELFGGAAGRVGVGGDPLPALRAAGEQPGAEAMTAVASAWQVAENSGARTAAVLQVVADTVRDEAAVRHEAEAQLATVRTTARVLAALPPITLIVFSGGLEPVWFLLRNPYGLACLGGAVALLGLGFGWVAVVRREATRSAWSR